MKAGDWTRVSTFMEYYFKPTSAFAESSDTLPLRNGSAQSKNASVSWPQPLPVSEKFVTFLYHFFSDEKKRGGLQITAYYIHV